MSDSGDKELDKQRGLEAEYDFFYPVCEKCHHSMSMHYGPVNMGGGNVEPLGCMHSNGECECMEYDENGDY